MPQIRPSENGEHLADSLTESQYLARETDRAKRAMGGALKNAAKELGHGVDPRGWVKEHPWLTLGATALAGFVAARAIVPSKNRSLRREVKKNLKAEEEARREEHREEHHGQDGKSKAKMGFEIAAIIGAELLKLVRPMIAAIVSRFITPPAPEEPENPAETAAPGTSIPSSNFPPES